MVGDGLLLMFLGMGTVLLFLVLLLVVTTLSGRVMQLLPAPVVPEPTKRPAASAAPQAAELVAVISAAISTHRRSRN